jgi:hypothetical protein
MRNVGGERESLSFYCPDRPLYIENVALRAMYSLSMLEHVLYDLYGIDTFTANAANGYLPHNLFM